MLTLLLLAPLAMALWVVPGKRGWSRIAAVFAMAAAVRVDLGAILLWRQVALNEGGSGLRAFAHQLSIALPVFVVIGAIVVFVAEFIQIVYQRQPRWAARFQPSFQPADAAPKANLAIRGSGALISFAAWLGIVAINAVPWGIISLLGPDRSGWLIAAIALSGAAIGIVSSASLLRALSSQLRIGQRIVSGDVLPPIGAALVLAIALSLVSVLVVTFQSAFQPFGWGLSIGLGVGLSVGLGQALGVPKVFVQFSSSLVTLGLCSMLAVWVSLNPTERWSPFEAVIGLAAGLVGGELLLLPGLAAFVKIVPYLQRLLLPIIGFATGYLFILLSFGGLFFATYIKDARAFTGVGSTAHMSDFVYFSLNTIAPLGYSALRPADELTRFMTGVELILGIAWLVVIFGALLAAATDDTKASTKTQ